jgi:hypothetical protein
MKTKILIASFSTLLLLAGFNLVSSNRGLAMVEQQQGVYIFMLSNPTSTYEYLGSVKKGIAWTGQPDEMLNSMIKKIKKEYPNADAIIFTSIDMDKADAIKFKD